MSADVLLLLEGEENDLESAWRPDPWDQPWVQERTSQARILVVDDDPVVRRLVERILIEAGYAVSSAGQGLEALDLALNATGAIDLTITDIRMPKMDGWELGRQLTERWPRLPILYLSGFDREFDRFAQAQTPPAAFLTKPFEPDELLRRVSFLLQQR
jgi:DNA-binding response OmpR family regulator